MLTNFSFQTLPQNPNILILGTKKSDQIIPLVYQLVNQIENYYRSQHLYLEKIFMTSSKKELYNQHFFNTFMITRKSQIAHIHQLMYQKKIPKVCVVEDEYLLEYDLDLLRKKEDHLWFHNDEYKMSTICIYDFDASPMIKRDNVDIIFLFYDPSECILSTFYDRYIPTNISYDEFYHVYIQSTKCNRNGALVLYGGSLYSYHPNQYKNMNQFCDRV